MSTPIIFDYEAIRSTKADAAPQTLAELIAEGKLAWDACTPVRREADELFCVAPCKSGARQRDRGRGGPAGPDGRALPPGGRVGRGCQRLGFHETSPTRSGCSNMSPPTAASTNRRSVRTSRQACGSSPATGRARTGHRRSADHRAVSPMG
jgi:hypothetical protein